MKPFLRSAKKAEPMTDVIVVADVCKTFPLPSGKGHFVALDGVDVHLAESEVVALLGRSGSGKSTLLRIMAALIPPSSGCVTSSNQRVSGPNPDVAMVFQSFALLPWLTVIENVELGLEARALSRSERRPSALRAIDVVGLGGFESAYPKELSGGMKQRVGFARALVLEPKALFMDEPFSALDVLTAENLRGEIDDLWNAGKFPAKCVLIVTHNIEEAVFLADRVIVLGSNPGVVRGEVRIDLLRPHDRNSDTFKQLVDYLYLVMTNPGRTVEVGPKPAPRQSMRGPKEIRSPLAHPLPHVPVGAISGFLGELVEGGDGEDGARLGERLALSVDEFLSILEAAVLLGFAEVRAGRVNVTPSGRQFESAKILESKHVFRAQVLGRVAIVATITRTLAAKRNKTMRADFFIDLLDEYYPQAEAWRQFDAAVEWGRYAELFSYDASGQRLVLDDDISDH
jgi:NitT/TauT family transport system ATP-binding protein